MFTMCTFLKDPSKFGFNYNLAVLVAGLENVLIVATVVGGLLLLR